MNQKRPRGAWLAGAALLGAAVASGGVATANNSDPKIPFERYTLDNGLEVILHQDNSVPLVAVDVWFHVGSGDEMPGKSGFAHLFEHMLFQGSTHVGEDRHFEILKSIGSTSVNGSTSTDRTNYFEVVPSNQLEAALWLESDRMGYMLPLLTEKSFANQQEVVRNERRQRVDNVPYGKARSELHKLLYPEGHPYRYMVIGKHEDLKAATLEDVRNFFKTWYVPANATLVIAGDFEPGTAKKLVEKWFGSFPKSERPKHRKVPMPQVSYSRKTVEDPFAKLRAVQYVWHTPAFFAPGDAELDFIGHVLTSKTGRLQKRLVLKEQLAVNVSGGQRSMGHSSMFMINVFLRSDADLAKVDAIVEEEVARLAREPISKREFDRFVAQSESSYVWGLQSLLARAETMQRYNHYVGTPDFITGDLDRYRKTTPDKIRDVAARYLKKDVRTDMVTIPAKAEAPAAKGTR